MKRVTGSNVVFFSFRFCFYPFFCFVVFTCTLAGEVVSWLRVMDREVTLLVKEQLVWLVCELYHLGSVLR